MKSARVKRSSQKREHGFLLVSMLVTTFIIIAISIVTAQLVLNNYRISSGESYRLNAQFAADAAADYAITQINQDQDWAGTSGEVELLENSRERSTYEVTVSPGASEDEKVISAVGRAYQPDNPSGINYERKLEIILRPVGGGVGTFSVVTGVGGLSMSNNAKIVGGEVYVNGRINLSNSSQIGLTNQPVNVKAAHQSCPVPPDSTYPRVCASGENGQPITLSGNSHIYGEVIATNQANGAGMSNPGLTSGTASVSALPDHDREAQVAAVTSHQTGGAAGCSGGVKIWPANLKIAGNVQVSGSCKITVEGDVWVTGTIQLSNSAQLIVKDGLATPPVIMVDASGGFEASNSSTLVSNANTTPVGFRIITYWSQAACSPDCDDVTGEELYNSSPVKTIKIANSASGPNTEFYARWTTVEVNNGGDVGALIGQTVAMSNSATVTFGAEVTEFQEVPAAWVVDSYKVVYD